MRALVVPFTLVLGGRLATLGIFGTTAESNSVNALSLVGGGVSPEKTVTLLGGVSL